MMRFAYIAVLFVFAGCCSFDNCSSSRFNIATFNLRVPADKGKNSLPARIPRIIHVIKTHEFDVFGVQESVPFTANSITRAFPEFARLGVGRNFGGIGESCDIYYRRSRFECLDYKTFWLSATPQLSGSKYRKAGCPRICIWVKLKDKATGRIFNYLNTHLDHASSQARMNGVKVICANGLDDLLEKGETVFLTGDLNSALPNEKPDGAKGMNADEMAKLAANNPIALLYTKLVDTYYATETPHIGSAGTYHAYGGLKNPARIDYIFATKDVRVLSHKTVNDRPGGLHPSDHDAVVARVELASHD